MTTEKLRAKTKANKRLRKVFRTLNKLYFDGRLKEPSVLEYKRMKPDCIGMQSFRPDGTSEIYIDDSIRWSERTVTITLLHEMVHLDNGLDCIPHHGMLFYARIHKLFQQGAYDELL